MTSTEDRLKAREALLAETGWGDTPIQPLAADASTRSYARLSREGASALLMDAPPAAEGATCPPDANAEARRALGYNALARLAAGRLDAFVGVANWLNEAGVRAPKVYGHDPAQGFAVIEDFGAAHLKDVASQDEAGFYRRALEVLGRVRHVPAAEGVLGAWPLLTYDALALQAEADLLTEWYAPHYGSPLAPEAVAEWYAAWENVFSTLSEPTTLVLRDFHAENILVPDEGALAVIDFQDALVGQAAYDAVSLLEDARRDVDPGLAEELMQEDAATTNDAAAYLQDYAVLALQRNAKILGVFARLIHRDGKDKYAAFFPRVRAHVARDFDREAVAPVRAWAEKYMPQLLSDGPSE